MAALWQAAVWCVLATGGGETVLLDFYADWCGPCQAMMPLVEQLVRRGYPIRKINIERHPDLAARFGVRVVPCFVKLVNGREVAREVGQVSLARLEQLCQLGQQPGGGAWEATNPSAEGMRPGSLGRAHPHQMSGAHPLIGSAHPRTTKDGLPIPTVELGAPKAAPAFAASGTALAEGSSAHGSAGLPPAAGPSQLMACGSSTEPPLATGCLPAAGVSEQDLVAATVRLRVYHGGSLSHGTGTIIDARQGEALILTCGHLFRESQGQGRIEVDLFGPSPAQKLPGRLIAWNDQRDLGLVSIRTSGPVRPVRVAPVGYPLKKGLIVFSAGCDHGQQPTVHKTWIVSINRYVGAPNLQVADQPVSGRSGGGLFTQEGYLIGVCNAADPADREGLFSSLPAIHSQLDELGLQFVYQAPPILASQTTASDAAALAPQNLPCSPPDLPSRWPFASQPALGSDQPPGRVLGSLPAAPRSGRQDARLTDPGQPGAFGQNPLALGVGGPAGGSPPQNPDDLRLSAEDPSAKPMPRGPLMELVSIVRATPSPHHSEGSPLARRNSAPLPNRSAGANPSPLASPLPPGPPADQNLALVQPVPASSRDLRADESSKTNPAGWPASSNTGGLSAEESALWHELVRRHRQGAEIIFIVRPRNDPQANSEIFVLHEASPELLARLGAAGQKTPLRETSLVVGTPQKAKDSPETSLTDSPSPGSPPAQDQP